MSPPRGGLTWGASPHLGLQASQGDLFQGNVSSTTDFLPSVRSATWEFYAVCRSGPVRGTSQGESRLRRIIGMAALERRTADIVPDQPAQQSTEHRLRMTKRSDLGQRPWPERDAFTRSNSQTGTPGGTDSMSSRHSFDVTLSELARKPPTGNCWDPPLALSIPLNLHTS